VLGNSVNSTDSTTATSGHYIFLPPSSAKQVSISIWNTP
jgi:hypothetical protein